MIQLAAPIQAIAAAGAAAHESASSPSRRRAPSAAPNSDEGPLLQAWASKNQLRPTVCNSVGNAGVSPASTHLVTVTHPFHPRSGQGGVCIAKRGNRSGKRWMLRFADGQICSVPPQWTDATIPDPEVGAVGGRTLCSLTDLLELGDLVAHLMSQRRVAGVNDCKDKYAAVVRQKTPQSPWGLR